VQAFDILPFRASQQMVEKLHILHLAMYFRYWNSDRREYNDQYLLILYFANNLCKNRSLNGIFGKVAKYIINEESGIWKEFTLPKCYNIMSINIF
jgi:hypothetical protein